MSRIPRKSRVRRSRDSEDWFDKFQKALEESRKEAEKAREESRKALDEAIEKSREESRKEAEKAREESRKALDEAIEKSRKEAAEAREESRKALDEAIEKSRKAQDEAIEKSREESRKALDEAIEKSRKAQEESRKAQDEVREKDRKEQKQIEKSLHRAFGDLSNKLGSIVESVMTPDLPNKFKSFGFTFNRIVTVKWTDSSDNPYAQIDGLLENGHQALAVEVKTTLRRSDVDDHRSRMEKIRAHADARGDHRQFYAAIAAMVADEDPRRYALSQGFFLIEPAGEDVAVTPPDSSPQVW